MIWDIQINVNQSGPVNKIFFHTLAIQLVFGGGDWFVEVVKFCIFEIYFPIKQPCFVKDLNLNSLLVVLLNTLTLWFLDLGYYYFCCNSRATVRNAALKWY